MWSRMTEFGAVSLSLRECAVSGLKGDGEGNEEDLQGVCKCCE